jgi:hypothetical protein
MKLKWIALSAVALSLGASTNLVTVRAYATPAPSPAAAGVQERGWDEPPSEFRDVQRQGFHDGVEGARKDFDNHRPPSPENRDEYRHPHVSRDARHDYREAFRRGYQVGMQHMMGDRDHHHDHD